MRRLGFRLVVVLLGLALYTTASYQAGHAQAPVDTIVVITSPVDGAELFGRVTISGSAMHPTTFSSYTLEYNDLSDPAAPWLLVQPRVQQQVQDSVLGEWSTNMVPDGTYRLRLRVFLSDGQIGEYVASNLKVVNTSPTPVPTAQTDLSDTAPALPTPGPSPTSPIAQPPSNNPSDNSVSGFPVDSDTEPVSATNNATQETTHINLGRVRSAFCTGTYLGMGMFAMMIGYMLVRRRLRPYTHRLFSNMSRDDWTDDV